jgi:TRAP-type mannitol/chloroaromatic compound transport system permease small subunit
MFALRRLVNGIDVLSKGTGRVVSYFVPLMMLILLYEVVVRRLFNNPTNWAHESTLYMFGSYFMLLGGYALYSRAHISMDLLYGRWSPRRKAIVDVFTYLLFFFFIGFGLFWVGGEYAWSSAMRLELSRSAWHPPIWPFKMMIPVGALLILLSGAAKFIRDLTMAIRGKEL